MLKFAGIFFILTGAGGFGRYLIRNLNLHLKHLMECREIFTRMDTGREYLCLPCDQLLRRAAKGRSELFAGILEEVAEEMEKNREADAKTLWQQAFSKRKDVLCLKEEETELLLELSGCLLLEENHTKAAQIYFMQLEDKIVQAMEEKKEKQKLYGTVSVLLGLFLVILLL